MRSSSLAGGRDDKLDDAFGCRTLAVWFIKGAGLESTPRQMPHNDVWVNGKLAGIGRGARI